MALVETDAAAYAFPAGIQGVLSTFALTLVSEYEQVIDHAARALASGRRMVIADSKKPSRWPLWLVNPGVMISQPFGVSLDLTDTKPWQVMSNYLAQVAVTELFGGKFEINNLCVLDASLVNPGLVAAQPRCVHRGG